MTRTAKKKKKRTEYERITYLVPRHMRLGEPALVYVQKQKREWEDEPSYWIGVAYNYRIQGPPTAVSGSIMAYTGGRLFAITKELYDAFVAEAMRNRKRYAAKPFSWEELDRELGIVRHNGSG